MTTQRITIHYILIFIILLVGVVSNYLLEEYSNKKVSEFSQSHSKLLEAILLEEQLDKLKNQVTLVQSRSRGYIITGDTTFISNIEGDIANIETDLQVITQFSKRDTALGPLIDSLNRLVIRKIASLHLSMETYRKSGRQAAEELLKHGTGVMLRNKIYAILDSISGKYISNQSIQTLKAKSNQQQQDALYYDTWFPVFSVIYFVGLGLLILYIFFKTISMVRQLEAAQGKMVKLVSEKDFLMREVHHRVKNNLQIMSSVLFLKAQSVREPVVQNLLSDIRQRLRSMALIHERLMQTGGEIARVEMSDYLSNLLKDIRSAHSLNAAQITFTHQLQCTELSLDQATNCGFIVNEAITNAIKYAFPTGKKGTLKVSFTEAEGRHTLTISDTGVGLPEHVSLSNTNLFGVQLIKIFTEQLHGKVSLTGSEGTTWVITF
jgi:two-component sensor histidine kinase